MPFFWQKSDRAVRLADVDLAADEKLIGEPMHVPLLTDEEALIIHNLVELQLIDAGEEESFLRRKENQAGRCLDERKEKGTVADGCPVLGLVVQKPAGNIWSLLLHVLAVLFAVMGWRFLNQAKEMLEANTLGVDARTKAGARNWADFEYDRFWSNGAADVLPLVSNP